jgi:phenylpropionate dioxygenase-like ring-hydroxylating dioxygenase large terminal subunit
VAPQQDQQQRQHKQRAGYVPDVAGAAAAAREDELFDWRAAWYPLAAISALSKDAPSAHRLLGQCLVVWWDALGGAWRCFEDACPHRLAPLSEGRIHESGQLQCTYHGWTFDGSGGCTSIPQLGDDKAHKTACSSSRSCVASFTTHVSKGLLWVYADARGPAASQAGSGANGDGTASSASSPAPPAQLLMPEDWTIKSPWFQRDIPLSYDVLFENFLDPSHVPHSHHGVVVSVAAAFWLHSLRGSDGTTLLQLLLQARLVAEPQPSAVSVCLPVSHTTGGPQRHAHLEHGAR